MQILAVFPAAPAQVRPPWPDEMTRLRHFLPGAFLFDAQPDLSVIVRGGVERIVAAAALSLLQMDDDTRVGRLHLRVDAAGGEYASMATALVRRAVEAARADGAARVFLAHTVPENSEAARFWHGLGARTHSVTDLYETVSRRTWERMDRLHHLARARGWVPEGAEFMAMLPRLVEPVRRFVAEHMPGSLTMLAMENANYKPEHSQVLLLRGEVKGVLLSRREGSRITVGLRLVAPELRGGIGWANLLLIHRSLSAGLKSGQETCRFELNPEVHVNTLQFALVSQARLVERRLFLEMPREIPFDGTGAAS